MRIGGMMLFVVFVIVVVAARMMLLVVVVIIVIVTMAALAAELRLNRRGAGVIVAQEGVLDRCVAPLQREFDFISEALDLGRKFLAGGEADIGFGPRGAPGACNARGDDGEHRAADQKDKAGAQNADLKNC